MKISPDGPCSPAGPEGPNSPRLPESPFGPVGPAAPEGPCGPVQPNSTIESARTLMMDMEPNRKWVLRLIFPPNSAPFQNNLQEFILMKNIPALPVKKCGLVAFHVHSDNLLLTFIVVKNFNQID